MPQDKNILVILPNCASDLNVGESIVDYIFIFKVLF